MEREEVQNVMELFMQISKFFTQVAEDCKHNRHSLNSIKEKTELNQARLRSLLNAPQKIEEHSAQTTYGKTIKASEMPSVNKQLKISLPLNSEQTKKEAVTEPSNQQVKRLLKQLKKHRPKHPCPSFILFYKQKNSEKDRETGGTKLAVALAEQWKNMTSAERQPYTLRSQQAKAGYVEQMKQFKAIYASELESLKKCRKEAHKSKKNQKQEKNLIKELKQRPQKIEQSSDSSEIDSDESESSSMSNCAKLINKKIEPSPEREDQLAIKRPKGPTCSFFIYYREQCKALSMQLNVAPGPKLIKLASGVWNNLSAQDKKPYDEMAQKTRQRYYEQLEALKKRHPGVQLPKRSARKQKKSKKKPAE